MKSEIGILYLNDFNRTVLEKLIKEHDLVFTELFVAKPHIFVSTKNPLAGKKSVTIEELEPYPYLSFEQGEHNSFYFSEEIFSTVDRPKNIRVRDRATLFNLLIGLNAGTKDGDKKIIEKVYLLENVDHTNEHFSMNPKEQLAAVKDMRANHLVPLGNWHSHPESPSRPSEEDKRLAYDPTVNYLSLSLMDMDQPVLKAFDIDKEKNVTIEELVIQ